MGNHLPLAADVSADMKALTDQVQGMGGKPAAVAPKKSRRSRKTKR